MAEAGDHCRAIMESRHLDVVEMDAASHTGIDDIREIIESARYKPAIARYKVYIIDEVHMLSKEAFNGLLKTLEEPPEHVKFIFATTEIAQGAGDGALALPALRPAPHRVGELVAHLGRIAAKKARRRAGARLTLIARAAEGSVRDALSLLDQAIALGAGKVDARRRCAACWASPTAAASSICSRRCLPGDAGAALAAARRSCTATAPSPARCSPTSPRPCTP